MKLCKDCKWHQSTKNTNLEEYAICKNPMICRLSPVTGEIINEFCFLKRGLVAGECGVDAIFFEEKQS